MFKKLFKSKKQDKPIPESKTFKLGMNFKQIDTESQNEVVKIVFVGGSRVGKTTLVTT